MKKNGSLRAVRQIGNERKQALYPCAREGETQKEREGKREREMFGLQWAVKIISIDSKETISRRDRNLLGLP